MKKIALVFALVVMTSTPLFAGEVVKLAIGDWAPYTSETDQKGKLLEKVVTEAFKLEGIDVQYGYFPWKRSYIYVEQGKYDGTFPWNKTEEREKEFYIHKTSLIKDDGVYFHLKTTPFDWNTIEDLKKYKVGVTIGYKQEELYKSKGITAESVPNEEQNFKKMLAGRIEVYQTSNVVGYSTISKLFSLEEASRFTHHPKAVETDEYYILFSKTTPKGRELADKLDSGLKKLKDSGGYDKILAEYNIK